MQHVSRSTLRLIASALGLLAALLPLSSRALSGQGDDPAPAIVAIGDLHGDYDAYFSLMRASGLVTQKGRWSGGKTIFVQTGDVPDRGPDTKRIIDHLMKLEREAARKGGEVVAVIGNHEAMNATGDLRYVTPAEYAAFATRKSKTLRDAHFKASAAALAAHYRSKDPALTDEGVRAAFEADAPLGFLEHRLAWSPTGRIGAWIGAHDAMRVAGDTLFVHGGVSAAYAGMALGEVNQRVRDALKAGGGPILEDQLGPLWYRGNAEETPAGAAEVAAAIAAFRVKRIVIGHTPSLTGIKALYGGTVVAIDTGASASYGGKRSFLRIDASGVVANDNGVETRLTGSGE